MRDHVIIYVNGKRHEVRGPRVFQSLSDFLRYDLGITGTKVVCAEGDCGSCTIFLGTPAGHGTIDYRTVTSCIQYLFQLDCTHIVTVEGLRYDGQLNPIQESMVRAQGAQCGFCTPGFIVSMHAMYEPQRASAGLATSVASSPRACELTQDDVRNACIGNLCRCTGYEPILRAGLETDASQVRPLNDIYPPRDIVGDLVLHQAEPVLVRAEGKAYFKPVSLESATQFKLANPHCVVIAGGTDVGVQINKGLRDPHTIMSLSGLPMLRGIERENDELVVGATTSLADLERACADAMPEYARMLYYFGSPPIRNAGTIGGNIANGSPIGDTMPALYVLDAEIELIGASGSRRVNINDFYTGYRQTVMVCDELIARVFIPLPGNGETIKLYKVSKRKDLDISAFTAALWMRANDDGAIDGIRIAYGGVGPNIIRLRKTEDMLRGARLDEATFNEAAESARREITPISDVRGSADYRCQLAENVMRKFFVDVTDAAATKSAAPGNGNGQVY
jgi:xanthine dehydrogenase small subunit